MIIKNYNITLRRLRAEDAEMVRQWRNKDFLKDYLQFQQHITPEMHKNWFKSIKPLHDHYFIIKSEDDEELGLVFIRKINFRNRIGEPGIFLKSKDLFGSFYPVLALITICDYGFILLGLNAIYSPVKVTNVNAKKLYLSVGSKIWSKIDDDWINVGPFWKDFYLSSLGIRRMLKNVTGIDEPMEIQFELSDTSDLKILICKNFQRMKNKASLPPLMRLVLEKIKINSNGTN